MLFPDPFSVYREKVLAPGIPLKDSHDDRKECPTSTSWWGKFVPQEAGKAVYWLVLLLLLFGLLMAGILVRWLCFPS